MKGRVGTPTNIERIPVRKGKFKVKKGTGFFCTACRGWIHKGQWYKFNTCVTVRHAYPNDCKPL